jgi:hypothetical protein
MRLCRARFDDAEEHTGRLKSYSIQQASWAVRTLDQFRRADGHADGRSEGRSEGRSDGRSSGAPKLGGIPVLARRRATSVILRSLPTVRSSS